MGSDAGVAVKAGIVADTGNATKMLLLLLMLLLLVIDAAKKNESVFRWIGFDLKAPPFVWKP